MPKVFQTENTDQQGKRFAHVEIILLLASTSFVVFILIEGEKNSSVTVLVLFGTKNSAVEIFATELKGEKYIDVVKIHCLQLELWFLCSKRQRAL